MYTTQQFFFPEYECKLYRAPPSGVRIHPGLLAMVPRLHFQELKGKEGETTLGGDFPRFLDLLSLKN